MKRSMKYTLTFGLLLSLMFAAVPLAQADHHAKAENPCNPCGGSMMKAENPCNGCGHGASFYINDDRNVLTFESKAPLEKIIGTTSKITGHIHFDPMDVTNKPKAQFEVELASMKTGIGLRDKHMRENYLETEKHPKAILTVDKILRTSSKQLKDQKPIKADVQATMHLHGTKQSIVIKDAEITYFKESEATRGRLPGDLLHVAAEFSVKLPEYKIKVPKMAILKLDETIKINVDVFATSVPPEPAMAENPCNPCGDKKAANPCNPCNPCGM